MAEIASVLLKNKGFSLVVGAIVIAGAHAAYRDAQLTPAQKAARAAAAEAQMAESMLASKYKLVREGTEQAIRNYVLASGKGICDTATNTQYSDVRYGTAAFQAAKPEPTMTGAYSFDCTYYVMGNKEVKRQTYWFRITRQASSGEMEGQILLDNQATIEAGLRTYNFRQDNL